MSALTFTLKSKPAFMLDCSRLTPDNLTSLSLKQISNLPLTGNKNSLRVSDFFIISGNSTQHIIFKNSHLSLNKIGHKMSQGQITIEGDCGDFLGANMQGGSIICLGNAGDRVGDQMRRGLILIDGNAGDYCASRMIAGTIGVYGILGKFCGYAMKRGTVLLKNHSDFHVSIQNCGTLNLPFLALLYQSFAPFSTNFNQLTTQRVQRFAGDLACNGNGEILILV